MAKRYIPDLAEQNALNEANYLRLEKLLGDCEAPRYEFYWTSPSGSEVEVFIEVMERFKFTTTLNISKVNPEMPPPMREVALTLRLYHDARMAEVVTWTQGKQLSGVYRYPNDRMYQIDEKAQANVYLSEWLAHLLRHGITRHAWVPSL
ncbi:MAG: DUF1249 domain-containing protein [Saccharospirillum sp.]|nr:DUF1249 domain-containing protein [Saccharospirillum sp.]